jgi:hypothetical protein
VTKSTDSSNCYQPCNEAMYTITTSSARWPATNFVAGCFEGMYNKSCIETYEENMVMLEVYYEKLNYESGDCACMKFANSKCLVSESPDDTVSVMLSNLGGQIGLFLGMSIISVLEFLVLGVQVTFSVVTLLLCFLALFESDFSKDGPIHRLLSVKDFIIN